MEAFQKLADNVRNWGRWGDDDEIGTLNLIDPAKRTQAASLVRSGRQFSLALPFQQDGPQMGLHGRTNPSHFMIATGVDESPPWDIGGSARFTDDYISMPLQCGTQWDSLAHVYYGDQLYNGYPASTVDSYGAHRNGIDKSEHAYISRGVLLDVARLKGVDCLEPTDVITTEALDEAEAAAGVEVAEGDIVLIRTGLPTTRAESGWDAYRTMQAGVHWETAAWFHDRGVAAVACDNGAVEAVGMTLPDVMLPFHMLALRDMGMPLGELWDLEELAADCAGDGVSEFMLVAPPLPVTGAVGAPVNPYALK